MNAKISLSLAALMLAAQPVLVSAHHSFAAEFDARQPIDLTGKITKLKWVNPHSWLYFDVTGADGTVTNWGVEFGTPILLSRIGLTKTDLPIGSQVHVKGYRARNGGPYGYSATVTLPDGRTFQTGGAQDSPNQQQQQPQH
jgi:Family of unknown function (DUF6152)